MRKAPIVFAAGLLARERRGRVRSRTVAVAMLVAILAGATSAGPVAAGQVTSRATLQAILGGLGVTEDFETLQIAPEPFPATWIDCPALDDQAVCNGQGPGLVAPGVRFIFGAAPQKGQWNDAGYWGASSKELLTGFQDAVGFRPILSIDFTTPVTAFGLDLREFAGFYDTAAVHVYGPDDTMEVGSLSVAVSGTPEFAGWMDTAGIGLVTIQGTETWMFWSPIIDNLEFGVAVDNTPPFASCDLGVNPDGRTSPNSDAGFRTVVASDDSGVASLVITDGTFTSGQLVSGDDVQLTVDPRRGGSDVRPGPGVLTAKITTSGQPLLIATDAIGNSTTVSCGPLPTK